MKLIKPSYKIRTQINGERILLAIEDAARTCYKSESKFHCKLELPGLGTMSAVRMTDCYDLDEAVALHPAYNIETISAKPLVQMLINKGHNAMLEFGGMITVKFICDRGVSHELVRHRLASFAQESTRYCNYGKDEHITFIIPNWLDIPEGTYNPISLSDANSEEDEDIEIWLNTMFDLESTYNNLIRRHWQPQQARAVLPNSLKTEINLSCNIREWREIFRQRTNKAAHPQMRELMCPLLDEFKSKIPILFDDINY